QQHAVGPDFDVAVEVQLHEEIRHTQIRVALLASKNDSRRAGDITAGGGFRLRKANAKANITIDRIGRVRVDFLDRQLHAEAAGVQDVLSDEVVLEAVFAHARADGHLQIAADDLN